MAQAVGVWWEMTGILAEYGLGMDWVTGYEERNGSGGVVEGQFAGIQSEIEA